MRKLLAAFALSIALAVCLAPSFALASSEGALSVGATSLDTQMTEGSGWIDVVNGPTFAGPNCDITIIAEPYAGLFGGTQYSYYVQFRVLKSESVVASEEVEVDLSDTLNPRFTFSASSSGSYTAVAYFVTKKRNKYTGALSTLSREEIAQESFTVTGSTEEGSSVAKTSLAGAEVTLARASAKYTGKTIKPSVKSVVLHGKTLKQGTDYTVSAKSGKKAGAYKVTVTGKGFYKGEATATFKITKAANKLAKAKVAKSLEAKSLEKVAATVALPKAKFGKITWKVSKADAKKALSLTKSGKVQVKKGAKAGTYTMKLKANVMGTANYKALKNKVVTVKVTIK